MRTAPKKWMLGEGWKTPRLQGSTSTRMCDGNTATLIGNMGDRFRHKQQMIEWKTNQKNTQKYTSSLKIVKENGAMSTDLRIDERITVHRPSPSQNRNTCPLDDRDQNVNFKELITSKKNNHQELHRGEITLEPGENGEGAGIFPTLTQSVMTSELSKNANQKGVERKDEGAANSARSLLHQNNTTLIK